MKLEIGESKGGAPADKEAKRQSSDANKSKDRRAAGGDGRYLKSISVPLRPADTAPTALVIHRTNTVLSHKQEMVCNFEFRRKARSWNICEMSLKPPGKDGCDGRAFVSSDCGFKSSLKIKTTAGVQVLVMVAQGR